MAALSSWCWRCWACTTTSAAPITQTRSASAITGTLRPAGSCGIRKSAACSAAPPAASSTAAPAAQRTSRIGPRRGASLPRSKSTFFGAGAAFFANCAKAEVDLTAAGDLSRLRCLGSTGSPLSADTQAWFNDRFAALSKTNGSTAQADIWWANISGGTDFAGAFIGGNRELPQTPGAMQCRLLGCCRRSLQRTGPRRDRRGR